MRFAVDTNLLVYAEGEGDSVRCQCEQDLFARLPAAEVLLPVQVLGELYNVLTRHFSRGAEGARSAVLEWAALYTVRDSTWTNLQSAMNLNSAHQFTVWDALILSVAAEQRCRALISEDMRHGFTSGGVTIVNPFSEPAHPLLTV